MDRSDRAISPDKKRIQQEKQKKAKAAKLKQQQRVKQLKGEKELCELEKEALKRDKRELETVLVQGLESVLAQEDEMNEKSAKQLDIWLSVLQVPNLNLQEIATLPTPDSSQVLLFQVLTEICSKRYIHTAFWPDFSALNLPYPIPSKPKSHYNRLFAIPIP